MLTEFPHDAVLLTARAGVELDSQHSGLALLDLEEALKIDPKQTEAYLIRGQIYLSQKNKKLAKRDFEKAISLGTFSFYIRQCR